MCVQEIDQSNLNAADPNLVDILVERLQARYFVVKLKERVTTVLANSQLYTAKAAVKNMRELCGLQKNQSKTMKLVQRIHEAQLKMQADIADANVEPSGLVTDMPPEKAQVNPEECTNCGAVRRSPRSVGDSDELEPASHSCRNDGEQSTYPGVFLFQVEYLQH